MTGRATEYAAAGELGTPDRHIKMVCAVWKMAPRAQIFIGAPDIGRLEIAWKIITDTDLDRTGVQYVDVFDSKLRAEAGTADSADGSPTT